MIVDHHHADDAAIVRLDGDDPERLLVLTADVITPIVDDPATFGAIAACNALSDVYAMGGRPLHALALAFFPDDVLPLAVLRSILAGAAELCARAGVRIVGGHTVRDAEPKFGLSVTGEVRRSALLANTGARPGQALILTKALGTGVLGSAIRAGVIDPAEAAAAIASMTTLNDAALAGARGLRVRAATDVTGFGLLGHLGNILRASEVRARLDMRALPALPGALGHIRGGLVPGGTRATLRHLEPTLRRRGPVDEARTLLAADAQTSGGLLFCVDVEDAAALVDALGERGVMAARIGELVAADEGAAVGTIDLEF